MVNTFRRTAVAILLCTGVLPLVSCHRDAPKTFGEPEDVLIDTENGWTLSATLYPVDSEPPPPGLILLHNLGKDRTSWRPFAARFQRNGYMTLAMDLRGHGESKSTSGETRSYREFHDEDWPALTKDIAAAKRALLEAGADPENVALAGAGLGGNLALAYAVDDPNVHSLILVSPGLDYKGISAENAIRELEKRPVLLLSTEGDTYSASSAATLEQLAPGFSELRTYPGSAHGVDLLIRSDSALAQIDQWLDMTLRAKKADAP